MSPRLHELRIACRTAPFLLPFAVHAAPSAPAAPVGLSQIGQVIGALLLVVVAIFVVAALAQRVRRLQQGRGRLLQVVDGIALSARDRLVLVDVAGERLLLGVSPGRIERLHVLPPAPAGEGAEVATPAPVATPFATALADARALFKQGGTLVKRLLVAVVLSLVSGFAFARTGLDAVAVTTHADGSQTYALTIQILLLMSALTLLPALLLAMTSFTRIVIVLAILRQALGTSQTPSSQVLVALALFMTAFIMMPVADRIYSEAVTPYLEDKMEFGAALEHAEVPLRDFMLKQTRESDLNLFAGLAHEKSIPDAAHVPFTVLVPSFLTSELKTAFQIGFLIFIPFLIIDLVVASVLISMGMMMLSPLIISLPFKIMLFVLVDGWALVVGSLASSFYV